MVSFQLFEVHVQRHLISFGCISRKTESDYLLMVTIVTTKQLTSTRSFSVICKIAHFYRRASLTVVVLLSRQTDVMHQSVFEMIHTEDQQEFRRNLHWAPNSLTQPETGTSTVEGPSSVLQHLLPENSVQNRVQQLLKCPFFIIRDSAEVRNKARKGDL